jgi:hypothetical protein
MGHDTALVTEGGWVWEDASVCSAQERARPLSCYFGDPGGCKRDDSKAAAKDGWQWSASVLAKGGGGAHKCPVSRETTW